MIAELGNKLCGLRWLCFDRPMSTPQGPNPPPGNAPGQPSDQPVWGRQPPGGWGQQSPPAWDQQQRSPHSPGARSPGQQGRAGWNQQFAQQGPGPQFLHPPGQQWPTHPPGQGYPPLPEPAAPKKSAMASWIIIGAVVVILGMVAVLGFVTPAFFVTRVFDKVAVQQGVQRVLTESYGIPAVGSVTCGENIEVIVGASFDCEAIVDSETVSVPVRVTSNDGNYEVGMPI